MQTKQLKGSEYVLVGSGSDEAGEMKRVAAGLAISATKKGNVGCD